MEAEPAASSRLRLREQRKSWNSLSLFFGGLAMMILNIGFVSPRSGLDLTLNMRYWGSPWLIAWSVATLATASAAAICQFMRWQLLNPKPEVEPWRWYEIAIVPLTIAVWLALALSAKPPFQ